MNTPMQELIKWINKNNSNDYPLQSFDIVKKAIDLLEKEKEHIIESYENGANHGMEVIEDGLDYIVGIEYYNKTYNQ